VGEDGGFFAVEIAGDVALGKVAIDWQDARVDGRGC